jgi:[ribosomal protein S18]-alanine N-acetyltransferase
MADVGYVVRDYEPADFETLWQIDQACFAPGIAYSRRELMTYMARKTAFTLIAQIQMKTGEARTLHSRDGMGGFLTADAGRTRKGHIITIDVLEGARRSGVGSLLLRAAEQRLRKQGCEEVSLETAVDNVGALAFYKRHQYFLVRTVRQYYATGVDAFVLKKDLRSPAPDD